MSSSPFHILLLSSLISSPLTAFSQQENSTPDQTPPAPPISPEVVPGPTGNDDSPDVAPATPESPAGQTGAQLPPNHPMAPKQLKPDGTPLNADPAQATPPAGQQSAFPELQHEINNGGDNLVNIRNVPINDVLQFLARRAGMQYFHNNRINGPDYSVTGHLNKSNPIEQMRSLASFYNLELFEKDGTIYALDKGQVAQMPATEWHYQLRYLRPKDIDQIKKLIQPMLSKETGIVNFEPKTNTVVVIDTARRIQDVQKLLNNIDREKGQISLETKILRTNKEKGRAIGVDWSSTLGRNSGINLALTDNLNALFNLDPKFADGTPIPPGTATGVGGLAGDSVSNGGIVLTPVQIKAVLRALADKNLVSQESSPTLITEDNEQAIIAIIDRIPIITATVNNSTGGTTTTEQVRYKIGEDDPTLSDANAAGQTREIGVTVTVTPNILPDGSVRMYLRPRSAQITSYVKSGSQDSINEYPRVRESSVETIARVPSNSTLLLGGFYEEVNTTRENKVPVLGDIPVINFFFKSKTDIKEQTSLVFAITPKVYNPSSATQTRRVSDQAETFLRRAQVIAEETPQPVNAVDAAGLSTPAPAGSRASQPAPSAPQPPARRYQRMGPSGF